MERGWRKREKERENEAVDKEEEVKKKKGLETGRRRGVKRRENTTREGG